jgi:hypothetical protein
MEDQLRMTRTVRNLGPLALTTALVLMGVASANARPAPRDDNSVITREQLGLLDRFLDTHPEVAQQLVKDPALVNNQQYVQSHPELQAFLNNHPEITADLQTHPQAVMREAIGVRTPEPAPVPPPVKTQNALTIDQAATLSDFLAAHPAIAKQLEANPSLIDNKDYMANNPALAAFLQAHPELAAEWTNSPSIAMAEVTRLQASESKFTSGQITTLDDFLNAHPAIEQKLESDPSLIDNKDFLNDNPDLASFLQNHPELAAEWKSNSQEAIVDVLASKVTTGGSSTGATEVEAKSFAGFLDDHPAIAAELNAHPTEIESMTYVEDHPELASYLKSNPQVATGLRDHPEVFMSDVRKLESSTSAAVRPTAPVRTPSTLRK